MQAMRPTARLAGCASPALKGTTAWAVTAQSSRLLARRARRTLPPGGTRLETVPPVPPADTRTAQVPQPAQSVPLAWTAPRPVPRQHCVPLAQPRGRAWRTAQTASLESMGPTLAWPPASSVRKASSAPVRPTLPLQGALQGDTPTALQVGRRALLVQVVRRALRPLQWMKTAPPGGTSRATLASVCRVLPGTAVRAVPLLPPRALQAHTPLPAKPPASPAPKARTLTKLGLKFASRAQQATTALTRR